MRKYWIVAIAAGCLITGYGIGHRTPWNIGHLIDANQQLSLANTELLVKNRDLQAAIDGREKADSRRLMYESAQPPGVWEGSSIVADAQLRIPRDGTFLLPVNMNDSDTHRPPTGKTWPDDRRVVCWLQKLDNAKQWKPWSASAGLRPEYHNDKVATLTLFEFDSYFPRDAEEPRIYVRCEGNGLDEFTADVRFE